LSGGADRSLAMASAATVAGDLGEVPSRGDVGNDEDCRRLSSVEAPDFNLHCLRTLLQSSHKFSRSVIPIIGKDDLSK